MQFWWIAMTTLRRKVQHAAYSANAAAKLKALLDIVKEKRKNNEKLSGEEQAALNRKAATLKRRSERRRKSVLNDPQADAPALALALAPPAPAPAPAPPPKDMRLLHAAKMARQEEIANRLLTYRNAQEDLNDYVNKRHREPIKSKKLNKLLGAVGGLYVEVHEKKRRGGIYPPRYLAISERIEGGKDYGVVTSIALKEGDVITSYTGSVMDGSAELVETDFKTNNYQLEAIVDGRKVRLQGNTKPVPRCGLGSLLNCFPGKGDLKRRVVHTEDGDNSFVVLLVAARDLNPQGLDYSNPSTHRELSFKYGRRRVMGCNWRESNQKWKASKDHVKNEIFRLPKKK